MKSEERGRWIAAEDKGEIFSIVSVKVLGYK